jgi:hypothetical protein
VGAGQPRLSFPVGFFPASFKVPRKETGPARTGPIALTGFLAAHIAQVYHPAGF